MHMRKALPALAAVLTLLVAAGCGGSGDDAKGTSTAARAATPIRIGTKNFTEQYILGELYRQALEAKGFRVQLKSDIGASEIIDQALLGGGIDMYPEYMGVLLSEIANERMRPRTAAAAYRAGKAFEERRGFTLLEPTPFTDSNALAVRPVTARRSPRHRSSARASRGSSGSRACTASRACAYVRCRSAGSTTRFRTARSTPRRCSRQTASSPARASASSTTRMGSSRRSMSRR